jgi:hypothetical protein
MRVRAFDWLSRLTLTSFASHCCGFCLLFTPAAQRRRPEDYSAEESSLKRQWKNYYQQFPNEAPSTVAQPAKFKDVQHDSDIQMFCNRPRSATSNPITLLHPIFGGFYDDSRSSELDPKISSFVLELAMMMCDFYDDEDKRTEVFREFIWNHFTIKLDVAKVKFMTDGHASVGFDVYINTKGKNEVGSTPADPALQSAVYYHYHIRNQATRLLGFGFPCLHIYYFGEEPHFRTFDLMNINTFIKQRTLPRFCRIGFQ